LDHYFSQYVMHVLRQGKSHCTSSWLARYIDWSKWFVCYYYLVDSDFLYNTQFHVFGCGSGKQWICFLFTILRPFGTRESIRRINNLECEKPWGFPSCFQNVPNSSSLWSHMICSMFNSHVYNLKSSTIGSTFVFILQLGVQRGASIG
jgi:hypothetical protein